MLRTRAAIVVVMPLALMLGMWRTAGQMRSFAALSDVDQEQNDGSGTDILTGFYQRGQTFTAGKTGSLDRVSLYLGQDSASIDLTVEIRSTVDGAPASILRGTSFTGVAPHTPQWIDVSFSAAPGHTTHKL
jgi:hypothetical protein